MPGDGPDQAPRKPAAKPVPRGLAERLRAWRARKIADPAFRRFAQRFVLTRPIANRRANDLYTLTAGFVYSQVLHACVTLGIFERLQNGPRSLTSLAADCNLPAHRLETLLRAARGLDLVAQTPAGPWMLSDAGAVVAANPGIRAMVTHHALVYRDLADPVALLREPDRETETAKFWSYVEKAGGPGGVGSHDAVTYSNLMHVTQDMVVEQVLDAHSLRDIKSLIDIGGGDGAFVSAAAQRYPTHDLALFDLPPVAEAAARKLAGTAHASTITAHGGSFFDDSLPGGYDAYSLVRVLYDHDDAAALRILKAVRRAMPNHARLIIAEPMDGPARGARLAAAYFNMYLLAMRSGKCRSAREIGALLEKAGFSRVRTHRTPVPVTTGLITARP